MRTTSSLLPFTRNPTDSSSRILISPDGRNYVGEWKDGKEHGQGTFTYLDGKMYVGEFKNGKWDGQGTFTFPNGNKGIGEFREKKPWNITEYDNYGNIIVKWVNGVRQ